MPYVHGKSIIKIAIADCDEFIQDLLPGYIDTIENCKVVIQALNGRELLEKLSQKSDTNLVIMDINLPELGGIEAAKRIKKDYPEIKILFSSAFCTELLFLLIIGAGGDGFIRKGTAVSEFRKGIYEVMKNGQYFQSGIDVIKRKLTGRGLKRGFQISEEEITFLKLVCTEKTYKKIAGDMKTSLRHVDYIRQGLFEKLEVHNRAELALYVVNSGIKV